MRNRQNKTYMKTESLECISVWNENERLQTLEFQELFLGESSTGSEVVQKWKEGKFCVDNWKGKFSFAYTCVYVVCVMCTSIFMIHRQNISEDRESNLFALWREENGVLTDETKRGILFPDQKFNFQSKKHWKYKTVPCWHIN